MNHHTTDPSRPAQRFSITCPNSRNARWAALKAEHPDLFERACQLDEHIRNGSGFNRRGNQPLKGQLFIHYSRVPLRVADLRSDTAIAAANGQDSLFDEVTLSLDCAAGACFT